jgi:hypothetical protein
MYLTYLDESGTNHQSSVLVYGGVIVPSAKFKFLESKHADVVLGLIPEKRRKAFQEFHSYDLWNEHPPFDGIPFADRKLAMATLLYGMRENHIPYFYSAIDKAKLRAIGVGSVDPIDVGFRMCLSALDWWARQAVVNAIQANDAGAFVPTVDIWAEGICLVIVDDGPREVFKARFRQSRKRLHDSIAESRKALSNRIQVSYLHDAMFFGDSTESVGLQMADVCGYVMRRHLEGKNTEGLFELLRHNAFAAASEPDWTTYRSALVCHDESPSGRHDGPLAAVLRPSSPPIRW